MVKIKTCIFISGQGSNLKNLIKKSREYNFPISIKLVISSSRNAKGIIYAKKNSIPYIIINSKLRNHENKIIQILKKYQISFVCLAGYMKIFSKSFFRDYRKRIINIHPSLLPKFKGLNTFSRILENKERKTGCTVHFVNEKLDGGKIITQKIFHIGLKDDVEDLKIKTQRLERLAFPEAIIKIFRNTNF